MALPLHCTGTETGTDAITSALLSAPMRTAQPRKEVKKKKKKILWHYVTGLKISEKESIKTQKTKNTANRDQKKGLSIREAWRLKLGFKWLNGVC